MSDKESSDEITSELPDAENVTDEPEGERMDNELLKALRRGDARFVRQFFSQDTESTNEITSEPPEDAENVTDGARICRSWRGVTRGGDSALHIVAGCGHLVLAKFICDKDRSLLTVRNAAGETPLHCAARAGAWAGRIVRHFISVLPADSHQLEEVLLAKDREGKTALYMAAEEDHAAVARELMSALPVLATEDDKNGVSPLYVAVLSRSLEVVQILIESPADVSYGGPNGQTALHAAARISNPEIAEKLLQWKPILAKKFDNSGSTLLHYLVKTDSHNMVRQLLKHDTSSAYVSDSEGLYPIHVASRQGRSDVVRELINRCPGMDELVNNEGRNFLHIAVEHKRAKIVKFVCQSLLFMKMINSKDYDGNTPLRLAETSQNKGIMTLLLANKRLHRRIINKAVQTLLDDEEISLVNSSTPRLPLAMMGLVTKFPNWKLKPEEEEEEEEDDQTVFGGGMERMDDELLDALRRGDERFIRRLFSPATTEDHSLAIDVGGAGQAGRRSCRGVTAGGNSALHIVATFGHLELAEVICASDCSLLEARNAALETPLHCAARSGADRIVSLFILKFRRWEEVLQGKTALHMEVLRITLRAMDRKGKTALHAAAEEGHAAVVRVLVSADPGLAALVDDSGASPLYAAVLSKSREVVQILIELESPAEGGIQAAGATSAGATPKISYAGPNGRTALHAAAIVQSPDIAKKLLEWKRELAKKVDYSRSTPLHYLAATTNAHMVCQLLSYDISPAYLSDSEGFYPIHIAARLEKCGIIRKLVGRCHDMDELVTDIEGRNFLHIAAYDDNLMVVKYVCQHRELVKMMNARDNEGNTPLHLAILCLYDKTVRLLLENRSVHLSVENQNGETPLNLAMSKITNGLISIQNPEIWIFYCLWHIGAICGPERLDWSICKSQHIEDKQEYKSTTGNLIIVSALIATVTFAAAFTMPGGYIEDDHQNGGTPTLARQYAFNAFIVSDFVAFLSSIVVTIWLMYAGSCSINPSHQIKLIMRCEELVYVAGQSMMAAFALSVYLALAPVNILIALAVCVFAFPSVLLSNPVIWRRVHLVVTIRRRLGWSGMCKACLIDETDFGFFREHFGWFLFRPIAYSLLAYIVIFGVPLIHFIKHLHFT